MTIGVGIALAFVAMLCWGFGDFLIQKSTRRIGDWETLFIMSFIGMFILAPFVWRQIPNVITNQGGSLLILLVASVVILLAALIDFEALKEGKLAIVEPIWSLEIPVAAFLAYFLVSERISVIQIILVSLLLIFLILVAFKQKRFSSSALLEKGVPLAILGAILMGSANFFMGWGGRISDPIMVNFFTDVFMVIATGIYLIGKGRFHRIFPDLKHTYIFVLPMSIADEVAWIAYVFSMSIIPIAVATALSESYIIIAVLLGLFISHEKLHTHQKIGLVGAIITAIVLAVITSA
ncbi:MAG: DMT family transporter [Candidatus Taylorbacteria bacterium]|nr:DMT family transporter [Candidatus Taylorbacteria bacterium]